MQPLHCKLNILHISLLGNSSRKHRAVHFMGLTAATRALLEYTVRWPNDVTHKDKTSLRENFFKKMKLSNSKTIQGRWELVAKYCKLPIKKKKKKSLTPCGSDTSFFSHLSPSNQSFPHPPPLSTTSSHFLLFISARLLPCHLTPPWFLSSLIYTSVLTSPAGVLSSSKLQTAQLLNISRAFSPLERGSQWLWSLSFKSTRAQPERC